MAALLHDVGHAPFSHASEQLFPLRKGTQSRYKHEHYAAEIVRTHFKHIIEEHSINTTDRFRAEDVVSLLEGTEDAGRALLWRPLIVGQMDADRIDYLLRDSLHAGVDYGRFDWRRLVNTAEVVPGEEGGAPRLGVSEGGWHAAEGLILARYFMFTQVYFHRTRVAFDLHLREALKEMLPEGVFPPPEGGGLDEYLRWEDWRVLGRLTERKGGKHGDRLANRNHYREVEHTPETPTPADLQKLERWREALGDLLAAEEKAENSWYTLGPTDIPVLSETEPREVSPLSEYSNVVKNIKPIRKVLLYVRREDYGKARQRLKKVKGEKND